MSTIRSAAITEFSLNGKQGTSTQAIADRAGITKQQLHYYISGKDELYLELLHQVLHDWKIVFSFTPSGGSPQVVLSEYIRKKLDYALDKPEMSRIFTREIMDGGKNLTDYWPNAITMTQEKINTINHWIDQGLCRPLDARLLLMHIWAMTQSYADYSIQTRVMLSLDHDAPVDRKLVATELIALVLQGILIEPVI